MQAATYAAITKERARFLKAGNDVDDMVGQVEAAATVRDQLAAEAAAQSAGEQPTRCSAIHSATATPSQAKMRVHRRCTRSTLIDVIEMLEIETYVAPDDATDQTEIGGALDGCGGRPIGFQKYLEARRHLGLSEELLLGIWGMMPPEKKDLWTRWERGETPADYRILDHQLKFEPVFADDIPADKPFDPRDLGLGWEAWLAHRSILQPAELARERIEGWKSLLPPERMAWANVERTMRASQ